ncbi:MAG: hypothetical protein NZL90_02735 [Aquificaceae bacterium]|nr:hypothetical protein [Aquificaceae bacterium]MDW8237152.1 hypothetical protein [Aquificaceae bacterium]
MKKNPTFELLEELSNLEYFVVKTPVSHQGFWVEWQERYSRAFMSLIATKRALRLKKLSSEELKQYRALVSTYSDVLSYLDGLKRLALSLQGTFGPEENISFNDEQEEL